LLEAQELQESTDFAVTTQSCAFKTSGTNGLYENIRIKSGNSRDACNKYFDKPKEHKDRQQENCSLDNKNILDTLRAYRLTGDHKTDLDAIKLHIELEELWKSSFPEDISKASSIKFLDALIN
jgi:2-oxoglutarate dehydrogenase complex dehydrogenase (E1) component-like enzyme